MTTLKSLLLATTILTACSIGAHAAAEADSRIMLAQQIAPEPEKKPLGKPPTPPPAQAPAARPAPQPGQTQPQAPAKPTPPAAAQPRAPEQKPAERPRRPDRPPAAQPRTPEQPPAARQPQRPEAPPPGRQQPPAAQPPASQAPAQQPPAERRLAPGPNQKTAPAPQQTPPPAAAPQTPPAQPGSQSRPAPSATSPGQPRRIEQLRQERREEKRGDSTFIREGDRTIIREGNRTIIRRDEADRFRGRPDVRTERRGSENFTIVPRRGGGQIVTVTDPDGRLIRRMRRDPSGRDVVIIDNRLRGPQRAGGYFVQLPPPVIRIPRERYIVEADRADPAMLYETLMAPPVEHLARGYSLDEIRYSAPLRDRMPRIDVDTITFDTGSWEVTGDQAGRLAPIADAIRRAIERNPDEVFLVEGHTDAVGADLDNLSLSDRRAESVANLMTDQFGIPPENLTTQGYGEQYLKIPTEAAERQNRRVSIRRITPLLAGDPGGPR